MDYNKDTVKVALNTESNARANVKDKVDISDQSWKARMVSSAEEYRFLAIDTETSIRRRYTKETDVVEVTKVEDDRSSQLKVTAASHGFSNSDNIVLGGFSNESINVQGTVSSKTDDTFVVTEIAWSSDYTGDTGYIAKLSDPITDDEVPALAFSITSEKIPRGKLPDYYPEKDNTDGSTTYYEDAVLVIHFKQVTSASSKSLYIRER